MKTTFKYGKCAWCCKDDMFIDKICCHLNYDRDHICDHRNIYLCSKCQHLLFSDMYLENNEHYRWIRPYITKNTDEKMLSEAMNKGYYDFVEVLLKVRKQIALCETDHMN